MRFAVKTLENKDAGQIDLADDVFAIEVKNDVLHRVVHWQMNKRRAGTHKTKDVSEVAGTGKKPHKQKGTGMARAGQRRRPQARGGGIVFGPVVRRHETSLPKKVRILGLKMALSSKMRDGKLIVLDEAKAKTHKTKPMAQTLETFGAKSALIVAGKELDANFARATANLPKIDVLAAQGANVYDILRRDVLILTKDAVSELTERLKG